MMRNSSNKKNLTEKQKVPVMNTLTVMCHINWYIFYIEKRENEERATRDQRLSQEPDHNRDIECGQDERWGNGQRSRRDQSNQDDM